MNGTPNNLKHPADWDKDNQAEPVEIVETVESMESGITKLINGVVGVVAIAVVISFVLFGLPLCIALWRWALS